MNTRKTISRSAALIVTALTVLLALPVPANATITGRNFWFYNGDTCLGTSTAAGQQCAFNDGDMTKGTLSVAGAAYRWRAGSGNSQSTNRCQTNVGPIPHGHWYFQAHYDNKTGTISGRAWYIQDMHCVASDPLSTLRTQMFVHTEETSAQGQSCPTVNDDPYCWEGPSDYYSNGCVKVQTPTDVASVDARWHAMYDASAFIDVDA